MFMNRLIWFHQSDELLLRDSEVDTYRASGPGGQKRNKTSSAVRIRHKPSGLLVIAEESRSQHENKSKALRRLRKAICLKIREPAPSGEDIPGEILAAMDSGGKLTAGKKHPAFLPAIAVILDMLDAHQAKVSDLAKSLQGTTAMVVGFLKQDDKVWEAVNQIRQKHGQHPLY